MASNLDDLDKLQKYIKDKEGLKLLSSIRKQSKKSIDYSNKLQRYYVQTIDGDDCEEVASDLGLK